LNRTHQKQRRHSRTDENGENIVQAKNEPDKDLLVFSQAIKMSIDGIIIGDLAGNITYVNDALMKMYGSTNKNDYAGHHILEFIAQKDKARATEHSMQCLETGQGKTGEFAALTKDGKEIPVEVTTTVIKDESGAEIGFIDIIRDETARKKTEEDLKQREEEYRLLFTNLTSGFVFFKVVYNEKNAPVDFICLEANDTFERLTGIKKADILGKKVTEAIPNIANLNQELLKKYRKIVSDGENANFEVEVKPYGIWLATSVYSPKKGYIAAVFDNITEQKQMGKKIQEYSKGLELTIAERTKELVQAQERLLMAERLAAIGELAGWVGHDLRNPLTSIKNAAYFLRKKQGEFVGDSGAEMLTVIDRAVEQANKIVSDLLDYSREIHLDLEEYSPKSLIDYILLTINVPTGIKIVDHAESFPTIWVDQSKMERVFINLIKNAVEAMPTGGTLEIRSRQNAENVEIAFSDTGAGMTGDVMAKIFTPLFTTKAQGMGFGLPICKRIIEAHGGKISVESAQNKGTTFTITLPIEPPKITAAITDSEN
jgi:PAS domain S-box-containing protein